MDDFDRDAEWLEADGLGGFASGTAGLVRTRRYHALLLAATTPPTGRMVLVSGVEAWLETPSGSFALSAQRYLPDVVHPDGAARIARFVAEPWPTWTFELPGGITVEHAILVAKGTPRVVASWKLVAGPPDLTLCVRPLLSGRDYHALQRENAAFRMQPERGDDALVWTPYDGVPGIRAVANGTYTHEPFWYRDFLYTEERNRGFDAVEDLAAPGVLRFELGRGEALLAFDALLPDALLRGGPPPSAEPLAELVAALRDAERARRAAFASRLHRAADAYVVRRQSGRTIVAGYPWFTDWGRDTFIAMRGLLLATGRLEEACFVLLEWAQHVSLGMLPNRFPDAGSEPEYNSVDAALWFVVAAREYLQLAGKGAAPDRKALEQAILAIVAGYAQGTRHAIRADGADGLLAAGEPGVQLTWMDARIGDEVVTPRIGKPVEVQALWLNALAVAAGLDGKWNALLERGRKSFEARFWNAERKALFDVVDAGHEPGKVDAALRPNQILAVGGLPLALLDGAKARAVVDTVERELWTPLGLRSLAPGEPGYRGRYEGDARARDLAYHQGTAWPWLLGPFVEAWVRVRGDGDAAKREARERFVTPLLRHLDEAGIGHVSEVADGDLPQRPGGCPFQAWSVGELLRLELVVLRVAAGARGERARARGARG